MADHRYGQNQYVQIIAAKFPLPGERDRVRGSWFGKQRNTLLNRINCLVLKQRPLTLSLSPGRGNFAAMICTYWF